MRTLGQSGHGISAHGHHDDVVHVDLVVVRELQLELLAGRDATLMLSGGLGRRRGGHGDGDERRAGPLSHWADGQVVKYAPPRAPVTRPVRRGE